MSWFPLQLNYQHLTCRASSILLFTCSFCYTVENLYSCEAIQFVTASISLYSLFHVKEAIRL